MWYTSPHFNFSLSFSKSLDVSSYIAMIIYVSLPLVNLLLKAFVPSTLLVVFFQGDILEPAIN
jgi:hypothetical protein